MVARKTPAQQVVTYLMELPKNRFRRITVPASWRVTFGPLVPPRERQHHENKTFALRFYESKDQQRAIFTDVLSFRDASLKMEERNTIAVERTNLPGINGVKGGKVMETRFTEWSDPAAPKPDDDGHLAIADNNDDQKPAAEPW